QRDASRQDDLAQQLAVPVDIDGVGLVGFGIPPRAPGENAIRADMYEVGPDRAADHGQAVREERVDFEVRYRVEAVGALLDDADAVDDRLGMKVGYDAHQPVGDPH